MTDNIMLLTDSYKPSHYRQYPPDTEYVESFLESRGGEFPATVQFGIQPILEKYLAGEVVTRQKIDEADEVCRAHFGQDIFNRSGWEYILNTHNGRLPIHIRSAVEGSVIPTHNVLLTMVNTDPRVPWLTNYLESLLVQAWYPITVATQSYYMRKTLLEFLELTGDPSLIDFKLHDFGFRGSTSVESSAIGGAAHLVNFKGTDTMSALMFLRKYYDEPMAGFSIPAAEHSTITSWGREHEVDAFRNMLQQYPTGLVAVVSDSYNVYDACSVLWGTTLREQVLARDGCLVVRPDSGYPPTVVVEVLERLGAAFGTTYNSKGFRVLHPKVRVIQGDGIDLKMLRDILVEMKVQGWSADNVAFGSGGGLLQKVNRDTCKFAFKCSAINRGGVWMPVIKDPVTDPGKKSKAGRLALTYNDGQYQTIENQFGNVWDSVLFTTFRDGSMFGRRSLAEIRQSVWGS